MTWFCNFLELPRSNLRSFNTNAYEALVPRMVEGMHKPGCLRPHLLHGFCLSHSLISQRISVWNILEWNKKFHGLPSASVDYSECLADIGCEWRCQLVRWISCFRNHTELVSLVFLSFACAELDWLSNPSFCVETVTSLSQQAEEAAALVSEGSLLTR